VMSATITIRWRHFIFIPNQMQLYLDWNGYD
jgi:hypothetical protein